MLGALTPPDEDHKDTSIAARRRRIQQAITALHDLDVDDASIAAGSWTTDPHTFYTALRDLCNENAPYHLPDLLMIADALEVNPAWLFSGIAPYAIRVTRCMFTYRILTQRFPSSRTLRQLAQQSARASYHPRPRGRSGRDVRQDIQQPNIRRTVQEDS